MITVCCHESDSTLKSAVFGLSSSLPPLVGGGGGLVCESVGKADMLSDHFDGKQSRESVDLTWILGVASKQLRLLHGRVGDSTIVVNSLSPQMRELVEDAIAS